MSDIINIQPFPYSKSDRRRIFFNWIYAMENKIAPINKRQSSELTIPCPLPKDITPSSVSGYVNGYKLSLKKGMLTFSDIHLATISVHHDMIRITASQNALIINENGAFTTFSLPVFDVMQNKSLNLSEKSSSVLYQNLFHLKLVFWENPKSFMIEREGEKLIQMDNGLFIPKSDDSLLTLLLWTGYEYQDHLAFYMSPKAARSINKSPCCGRKESFKELDEAFLNAAELRVAKIQQAFNQWIASPENQSWQEICLDQVFAVPCKFMKDLYDTQWDLGGKYGINAKGTECIYLSLASSILKSKSYDDDGNFLLKVPVSDKIMQQKIIAAFEKDWLSQNANTIPDLFLPYQTIF